MAYNKAPDKGRTEKMGRLRRKGDKINTVVQLQNFET